MIEAIWTGPSDSGWAISETEELMQVMNLAQAYGLGGSSAGLSVSA